MKNIKIVFMIGLLILAVSCSSNENNIIETSALTDSTTYIGSNELNSYQLFFKPKVGYVGDPMPFYDSFNKVQRILYLQDFRDGASTYHPIYCVNTIDAASYSAMGEIIPCGTLDEQDPALGTGSTVYKDSTYYTFYTGHKDNATSEQSKEAVLLATSTDFKTWNKERSFRLDAPSGYSSDDFRDPYVFYDTDDQLYHMLIATKKEGTAVLAQFVSSDLRKWTVKDPFFYNVWGRFYECPDVFKMGNYWYLIYSDKDITRQVQYFYAPTLAELQHCGDANFPPNEGKLDGTSFYAGKTVSDGTNRYIYGWCASRSGDLSEASSDWAGNLVAHKLIQNSDGTLGLTVPDAVAGKFVKDETITQKSIIGDATGDVATGYTLNANSSVHFNRLSSSDRITMTIQAPTDNQAVFGISFVDNTDTNIKYSIYVEARWKALKFDKVTTDPVTGEVTRLNINYNGFTPSSDGKYNITIVHERSVCVCYINDQYGFTNRIYNMQYNPWSLFSSDGSVKVTGLALSTF